MKNTQGRSGPSRKNAVRNIKLVAIGCVVTGFLVYFTGLIIYTKAEYGAEYERKAIDQEYNTYSTETVIPANMGNINDRNNEALALSYIIYSVNLDIRQLYAQPEDVRAKTLETLNEILEMPLPELQDYLKIDALTGKLVRDTNYCIIARNVPAAKIEALKAADPRCVYIEENSKRAYPHNSLAAQTIGFIRGGNYWGLENTYKEYLSGTPGRMFRAYNSEKGVATQKQEPQDGYTLITTLDTTIQTFAEEAVRKSFLEYNPKRSAIIVMNPKTGEVLAMAQSDSFDLNNPADLAALQWSDLQTGLDAETLSEALSKEEQFNRLNEMWSNYAISSTFEPGSIFKPIVVAAALEENIITPEDEFVCYGSRLIGGTELECWKKKSEGGHGRLDVTGALKYSCNVALMDIGEKLGKDLFYKYQREFGFGEKTGIDLPGELSVSSPSLLYPLSALRPVELATSSFGQGFNNTAIQAITAFSAVINGGSLLKPYLVSRIVDSNGNIIKENLPTIQRKVISQSTSDYMRAAMQSVVTPDGTGRRAVINGYSIGGKTGTAQQGPREKEEYVLSFIGYFPAEDPEYIALAIIDRPEVYLEGSTSTAPMLREVMENIINYKGLRPTGEVLESETAAQALGQVMVEDYIGRDVAMVTKSLNAKKFAFELIGSGDIVTGQLPPPESMVPEGTKIMLTITNTANTELNAVPFVVGLTLPVAVDRLKSAGLSVYVENPPSEYEYPLEDDLLSDSLDIADWDYFENQEEDFDEERYVDKQMPVSGGKVPLGTEVKLILK
ncbi:MAG: PASTA domain-containing protein [Clostridiales bacterium]|jgi:stage V sporulation protein D (sporulation-specific penicillin-binding protein)|nr:PASTA domain-containing protein [Clostridiales bacterium]